MLHIPLVESAALWLDAVHSGELQLPPVAAMDAAIEAVRSWKRQHTLFEPSRSCAVNARFHQHQDVILSELGLRCHRKSNPVAELLSAYTAADYDGMLHEYSQTRGQRRSLPYAT